MQFEQFQDNKLNTLLSQSKVWIDLDKRVKSMVPSALHEHFRVVCIRDDELVIYAYQPMVATKLKILAAGLLAQLKLETIHSITVKQKPKCCEKVKNKQFKISNNALSSFEEAARQLSHHTGLARALSHLVEHHKE